MNDGEAYFQRAIQQLRSDIQKEGDYNKYSTLRTFYQHLINYSLELTFELDKKFPPLHSYENNEGSIALELYQKFPKLNDTSVAKLAQFCDVEYRNYYRANNGNELDSKHKELLKVLKEQEVYKSFL